jgi:RecA-family ATPase
MCRLADLDPHRVDRLHVVSLAEEDATLAIEERGVLKPTPLFRRIEARLALIPEIKLVIVDNVADVFGANEIVRHLVRAFLSLWRGIAIRRDCAVLMLFHPSQAGLRDGSGTSGSTGWHNSVKSRLYLERIRDEQGREPDQDRRRLRAMKANYAPLGEDIELVYDQGQFVATAVERPFDNVTVAHLDQVRAAFATGTYKVSSQASEWGGFFVADLLGLPVGRGLKVAELNPDEKKNRRRVGTIIAQWIRAQEICTVQKRDERRHKTPHYGVPGVTRGDD